MADSKFKKCMYALFAERYARIGYAGKIKISFPARPSVLVRGKVPMQLRTRQISKRVRA